MFSRSAIWFLLAGTASLLVSATALAQTPTLPPTKDTVPSATPNTQIIPASFTSERVAATVNGDKILAGDVKKLLDQRPYPVTLTEEQKKQLRHAALDVLVDDALMRQYMGKHVPQINQADFNKEIAKLQADLKLQNKTLEAFLKESGQSEEQLRRDIVALLQWKALLVRFCPEDKAKTYFDTNKLFFDKVFVRASHILVKVPTNATKEQRDRAMQQILVLRQDIMTGKQTFEAVAKKHSECPTKDKGGDIGKFPYKFNNLVPEFSKTAYAMKVGEVSDVVPSVFGLHLIMVTERTLPEPSSFDALKETVREAWAQEEDLYQRILADQRKTGSVKVDLP